MIIAILRALLNASLILIYVKRFWKGAGCMLYVKSNVIQLTRGDTADLTVQLINQTTQEDYVMATNDTLTLTIKRTINDTNVCVQKTVTGTNKIHISPADTSELAFGKYIYDVELRTSDGDVYTIIEPTRFDILEEVTC